MSRNLATEAALAAEQNAAADPARDHMQPMTPFAIRDLSVLAYANGFTLWHYKAARIGDLMSSDYFGDAGDMMKAGDHIHVSAPDGSALLAVVSATAAAVMVKVLAA